MSVLKNSWGAFSKKSAEKYLDGFGNGSIYSVKIVSEILKEFGNEIKIIDFGCGNGQLISKFIDFGVVANFTGIDFSDVLLEYAIESLPDSNFINDDVIKLSKVTTNFKIGIYSHVIEMLESPMESLLNASKICEIIIIRFFEPPNFELDSAEIKEMIVDEETNYKVPYIRRKISKNYYNLILNEIKCKKVEKYLDEYSKDEVHVLYF